MKLIAKNALNKHLKLFWKNATGYHLKLLTFKKDRSLELTGNTDGTVTIVEVGFQSNTYSNLSVDAAKHQFKKSLTREFPRSHNVYFEQYKKN
ncbi:hypothetical protein OXT66_07605 [Lentilactobacillus senioris]|uniref:hypothetical protein n=1 Tax=Lentilactobacillus senioris TaxID=931534 RepID=UPI0022817417|nr:hypothetical protein [Lentilactobacillus senioris]MCY9807397.1 hypothetical protein [Lentilactobacillus senioris]